MFLLWHPSLTAINLSYTFPILETSATALCGTTGRWNWILPFRFRCILHFVCCNKWWKSYYSNYSDVLTEVTTLLYWIFKPHFRPRLGWSIFDMANIWSLKTTPMLPCADPGGYRAAQCAYYHLHGGVWVCGWTWLILNQVEIYAEIPQSWGYPSQKLTVRPWK